MSIREVFPGTGSNGFVELQMWAGGQNVVQGQQVTTYGPTGLLVNTFTMGGDVLQGGDQRSILIGETSSAGSPDFTDNTGLGLSAGGGAACFISTTGFGPLDCVSWGNFTGDTPSPTGNAASPGGISSGKSLTRAIAPVCNTRLDQGDDSDDSLTDFSETDPTPRNNAVAPTETNCPVPPNTTIAASPRPPQFTNQTTATFNFGQTGGTGPITFACKLDTEPAFTDCTSGATKSYSDIPEGSRTFSVRATGAGQADPSPATYTWTVDTTPPNTGLTGSQPADPTSSPTAAFTFTSTEPTSATFRCKLDEGAEEACDTGSKSYSDVQTGEHTFTVYAVDRAGNKDDSTPAAHSWTVDRMPPDTSITGQPDNPSTSSTADFDFESTELNSTFKCRLDTAASFTACPADGIYNGLNDGSHTFRVRAVDPLGNEDPTEASYTWTVDATTDPPPDTTITKAPKKKGKDKTPKVTFIATPATGATFQCRVDDAAFAPCSSPHTTAKLKLGKHTFEVAASGPGGADTTPAKASFKIVKK